MFEFLMVVTPENLEKLNEEKVNFSFDDVEDLFENRPTATIVFESESEYSRAKKIIRK